MNFSEHIIKLRIERGVLQREIAKAIGVSVLTYQRYEYGEREPRISQLIAIADYYDMSLDELVCRDWKPGKR